MAPLVEAIIERWFTPGFRAREPAAVEQIRAALLATPAAGYAACCEAIRDMDQRVDVTRIQLPTLVIGGTYDPMPTVAAARAWAATLPRAQFVELAAAHLSNIEAAQAFNAAVLRFLTTP
jgi:3-oxoadipate enol-lactonase